MNRTTWLSLALASMLGCHHNIIAPQDAVYNSGSGPVRRFPNSRSQIDFVAPRGMKIGWETGQRNFVPAQISVPGRYNFDQAAIYRLKVTDVPGRADKAFYPTLEVAPSTPRTDAYLTHNAIPIEFTDEDFDQVTTGNFVTKVIYLPDPQHQELAIAGVETLVSTRLDPGVDPIAEADRRGTILAIVRLGGIDLEMPQSASSGSAGSAYGSVMGTGSPGSSGQIMMSPQMAVDQNAQPVIIHR